jgi:hypothetical protein
MNIEGRLKASLNLLKQIEELLRHFRIVREKTLDRDGILVASLELLTQFGEIIHHFRFNNQTMSDEELEQASQVVDYQDGISLGPDRVPQHAIPAEDLLAICLLLLEKFEAIIRDFETNRQEMGEDELHRFAKNHLAVMEMTLTDFRYYRFAMSAAEIRETIIFNATYFTNTLVPRRLVRVIQLPGLMA